jgi:hypothetical protein
MKVTIARRFAEILTEEIARLESIPGVKGYMMETADCGHTYEATGIGTGYATDPDTQKTMCYPCADAWQREQMKDAKCVFGYLSSDGKAIETWTGGRLADVTRLNKTRSPLAYHAYLCYVRATDVHGQKWWGKNGGEGVAIKLHRIKDGL